MRTLDRPERRRELPRAVPGVSGQTYEVACRASKPGLPCAVTIEWTDDGKPHEPADRTAMAERMKRLDAAAAAFLNALYEERVDAGP